MATDNLGQRTNETTVTADPGMTRPPTEPNVTSPIGTNQPAPSATHLAPFATHLDPSVTHLDPSTVHRDPSATQVTSAGTASGDEPTHTRVAPAGQSQEADDRSTQLAHQPTAISEDATQPAISPDGTVIADESSGTDWASPLRQHRSPPAVFPRRGEIPARSGGTAAESQTIRPAPRHPRPVAGDTERPTDRTAPGRARDVAGAPRAIGCVVPPGAEWSQTGCFGHRG